MAIDKPTILLPILTAIVSYFAWSEWSKYKAVHNTPRSTVRSIAIGQTELHGTITTDNPVNAPITGKPSVAYTYRVDEAGEHDETLKRGRGTANAVLEDQTGSVAVNPAGFTIENGHTYKDGITPFQESENDVEQRLHNLDVDTETLVSTNRNLSISETRIEPGDEVYLLGRASDNPRVEDTTADTNQEDLLIHAGPEKSLIALGTEDKLETKKGWHAYVLILVTIILTTLTIMYLVLG